MPTPALLLILATVLPLGSFAVLVVWGKRMGNPFAGYLGTAAIGLSFALSMGAMVGWMQGGDHRGAEWGAGRMPIVQSFGWIPVGDSGIPAGRTGAQEHPGYMDLGIYVDSLTVAMFSMVTLVALLVHIFSIGYMAEDKRFARFFTYLGLFCFSMLGLVIGGTILQLFVFWELVGLCSYLLIGFWYEKKSASNAAIKAFVTNRIGDFGFLIGFGILFYHLGNATLPDIWAALGSAGQGGSVTLANGVVFSATALTLTGIGLFFGAVGKSAQFPLHVWLPDAMEGPTPVSALIHAATMVAAGVYLVGRIFPILTPDARLFIAIIGCITLAMAALIALAQTDIKKVLAYSTLSQLGYMILAMGVGSWVGALFHLITHAFFKALLFLGSGSVIHAAHHEQEMPQYGGLWRKIPITAVTFGIAVLAIAGMPFLAGYYSKSIILTHAAALGLSGGTVSRGYWLLFAVPAVVAYLTPFYMTRCWMLTFAGKPRNQRLYDHAHEAPLLWVPLVVLAGMTVVAGSLLGVKELLQGAMVESQNLVTARVGEGAPAIFASAWPVPAGHHEASTPDRDAPDPAAHAEATSAAATLVDGKAHETEKKAVGWAWLAGIAAGVLVYARGYSVTDRLMRIAPLRWMRTWLYRRMYFDELYRALVVGVTMGLSQLSAAFDKYVIDGLVNGAGSVVRGLADLAGLHDRYVVDGAVGGVGRIATGVGNAVRNPASGRIRLYVAALLLAVAVGVAGAVVAVLS